MDWFKRKQAANTPPPGAPKSPPPPSDVESTEVAAPVAPTAPTAEEIMQAHEEEMKETVAEYTRKLESLAQILFEKSEENDQLVAKFAQQEDDMKVLIDKMVSSEKELETYKDNQVEYKRRLEVLTDCLEDLARENMKLAARGAPASRPDDYEEDRMPTLREVQIGKTKSEMAAESAAKEVPIKPGMRSTGSGSSPTTNHKPSAENTGSPSSRRRETPAPPATIETSSSAPDVNRSSNDSPESDRSKPKDHHVSMRPASGGLVLPSKSKSKPDVRDAPTGKREDTLAPPKPTTPPPSSSTGSSSHSKHGHKRVPSTEIDTFSNMANDPKALMTVLKKYKGQADSLRRVRFFYSLFLPSTPELLSCKGLENSL